MLQSLLVLEFYNLQEDFNRILKVIPLINLPITIQYLTWEDFNRILKHPLVYWYLLQHILHTEDFNRILKVRWIFRYYVHQFHHWEDFNRILKERLKIKFIQIYIQPRGFQQNIETLTYTGSSPNKTLTCRGFQ